MKMQKSISDCNVRSAPRGAAVFIVDSCILTLPLFTARMIVLSINSQKEPDIYSFFELQAVLECFADSSIDLEVSMRVRGKKNC